MFNSRYRLIRQIFCHSFEPLLAHSQKTVFFFFWSFISFLLFHFIECLDAFAPRSYSVRSWRKTAMD